MLDALRTKKWKTRLMWATIILIVPGFVAVTGSIGGEEFSNILRLLGFNVGEPEYAVKVADVAVSQREYYDTRKNVLQNYRRMYSSADDLQIEKAVPIDNQTMNSLIQNILLNLEAEKMGLFISEQEILQYITSSPMFIDETKKTFSKAMYRRYLNYLQMGEAEFEAEVHKQLLMDKLQARVQNDIIIPEDEIRREFNSKYEEVKVDYIKIDPNSFRAKAEISEDEIKEFYEENKEKYKTWEKMTIDYVEFNVDNYLDKIEITDEAIAGYIDSHENQFEIPAQYNLEYFDLTEADYAQIASAGITEEKLKAHYEENKAEFETSEQFRIDYVYLDRNKMQAGFNVTEEDKKKYYNENISRYTKEARVKPRVLMVSADTRSKSEAVKIINKAAERINGGEDFAKVAAEVSEDMNTKDEGGGLDMMIKTSLARKLKDPKLVEIAFALKPGEVSKPQLSGKNYYLLTVDEREEEVVSSYESSARNAELSIRQSWYTRDTTDISNKIVKAVESGKTFKEAAAEHKLEVYSSNPFRNGEEADARLKNQVNRHIFRGDELNVDDVIGPATITGATLVMQITEKNPPIIPEYDAVVDRVKNSWRKKEQRFLLESNTNTFMKSYEEGEATFDESFEKINKDFGNKKTTKFTNLFRADATEIPGLNFKTGRPGMTNLIKDLGRITIGAVGTFETPTGLTLFQLAERKEAFTPEFDELREEVALILKKQEARKLADKDAFAFRDKIDEKDGDFEAAASEDGIEILTTGSFNRGAQSAPGIGDSADVTGWSLGTLEVGDISEVLTDSATATADKNNVQTYYVLKYKDKVEPQIKPLSEVREEIKGKIRIDKALEMTEVASKNVQLDLDSKVKLENIAKSNDLTIKTTESFSRKDPVAGLGIESEFSYAAFNLKEVGDLSRVISVTSAVSKQFDGYYVLRLAERTAPKKDYEEERETILNTILNQYSSNFQREWLKNLQDTAEENGIIKRNEYLIERLDKRHKSLIGG